LAKKLELWRSLAVAADIIQQLKEDK
jgi:hypothetical protein